MDSEFTIGSSKQNLELVFDLDVPCAYETQILNFDGNLHGLSVMTEINSVATNSLMSPASAQTTKSVELSLETSNLNFDSDGSIAARVYQFKIQVGSPDINTATGSPYPPKEVQLKL